MKIVRPILISFILLIYGCDGYRHEYDVLKSKIDLVKLNLDKLNSDSVLHNSPMQLFALNTDVRVNNIIKELKSKTPDQNHVFNEIALLKKSLTDHSLNDSLIDIYNSLLSFNTDKLSKRNIQKIEINILSAQYIFIREMFLAISRLNNNEENLPYIIPLRTQIKRGEEMEAFIIIPNPKITKLVFLSPDSIKYDDRKDRFIYLSGFTNNFICISVKCHNPVILATTSLSKILSPKYLLFNLYTNSSRYCCRYFLFILW